MIKKFCPKCGVQITKGTFCEVCAQKDFVYEAPLIQVSEFGRVFEKGIGPGTGYTKNYPVLPGEGDEAYKKIIETDLIPTFDGFKPQVIVLSTGFDAHKDDVMSGIKLSTKG